MSLFTRRTLFGIPLPFAAASAAPFPRPKTAEVWRETQLYFGTSQPNGTIVTDREFADFIDVYVTPRFPDGLTLLSGYGQFRSSGGLINKEKSMVLILFYPADMPKAEALIEEIRDAYVMRFAQESVLRADKMAGVSF
jgi:hypothetical protein